MARILRGSGKRGAGRGEKGAAGAGAGGGIDRRSVIKAGGLIGAAAIITSKKTAFAQSSGNPPAPPVLCGIDTPVSPPTTPFRDTLPIPPPAVPVLLNPLPTQAANIG